MTTTTLSPPTDQPCATKERGHDVPQGLAEFQAAKPGVYSDIPAEVYHAAPLCSFSRLAKLARSPMHCLDAIKNTNRTDAMILGDAAHLFVLQPELVEKRYTVAGTCAGVTKDNKFCKCNGSIEHDGQWYCGMHDPRKKGVELISSGRAVLGEDDCDKCVAMRDAVLGHPRARDLIEQEGPRELSIIWQDRETGITCKARIDKLNTRLGAVCDLKTTPNASRKAFMRKIYGFGYHIQSGMYLPGACELGLDARHFIIIPVEKTAPFAAAAYRFKDEVVEAGKVESRRLMRLYAACAESNQWPSYSDQIEDIDLPAWDWRDMEGEE